MKFSIILCFLLAYAVCAQSGHIHHGRSEMEDDEPLDSEAKSLEEIPGNCFICKLIMRKVKYSVPYANKAAITRNLNGVCHWILFYKRTCHILVRKYYWKLRNELMTHDGARTACIKMHLCKW